MMTAGIQTRGMPLASGILPFYIRIPTGILVTITIIISADTMAQGTAEREEMEVDLDEDVNGL
jgi:hypothetical protein